MGWVERKGLWCQWSSGSHQNRMWKRESEGNKTFLWTECRIMSWMFIELLLHQLTKVEERKRRRLLSYRDHKHARCPPRWMTDFAMEWSDEMIFEISGGDEMNCKERAVASTNVEPHWNRKWERGSEGSNTRVIFFQPGTVAMNGHQWSMLAGIGSSSC